MKHFLLGVAALFGSLASGASPTFSEQVAPIVFTNCAGCHRAGEAAPFPLTTFAEVRKRGRLIVAVTEARYMPPWHAAPGDVRYRDERRLTEEQIETLRAWVDAGMPEGDPAKTPELPPFADGWQLGEPDLVVEMSEAFQIPADGPDLYRSFAIPIGLDDERWVRAIEFRPAARGASHHALFFADASGAARQADEESAEPGFEGMSSLTGAFAGRRARQAFAGLGGWAVGGSPRMLPEGLARRLPAGSDLVVQMHFHPSGKVESEKARVGLYFAEEPPERTLTGVQVPPAFGRFAGIDIPAGEADFVIRDSFTLPVDVEVFGAGGHAHYLCTQMRMTAVLPDGAEKQILWIDRWDFAWQERYYLTDPLRLPAGTRLDVEIRYDNSENNPSNPHSPPERVAFGRGSEDEMGAMSLELLAVEEDDLAALRQAQRAQIRDAVVENLRQLPGRLLRGRQDR